MPDKIITLENLSTFKDEVDNLLDENTWLENFSETENSDNRKSFLKKNYIDTITIGGTSRHRFEVPFLVSEVCDYIEVIYKQGLEIVTQLLVTANDCVEFTNKKKTLIIITLSPLETQKFGNNLLNTFVQLKIKTKNNEVFYNKPHYIKVIAPLRVDRVLEE